MSFLRQMGVFQVASGEFFSGVSLGEIKSFSWEKMQVFVGENTLNPCSLYELPIYGICLMNIWDFHGNFVGKINFVGMNAFMGIHGISITYPRKSSRP